MIELKNNQLIFSFPDLHEDAVCRVDFQRTLRIPDDNREYPLPPGLGRFPMAQVAEHASRLPVTWAEHGGVLLPMYQAEALWINFASGHDYGTDASYPFALKIAAGKVNAVTGDAWCDDLVQNPQDYLVIPDQPWLDGFCVRKGLIRQFVAMPLGLGYTAEEQLSGAAEHGGLQIIVYPMKRDRYQEMLQHRDLDFETEIPCCPSASLVCESASMGLAPGGLMHQEIYEDEHGYDAWDPSLSCRCFVHILNSAQWEGATGESLPGAAPTANDYTKAGLPWFEYYDDRFGSLNGAKKLAGLDSVATKGSKLGAIPLPENDAIKPAKIIHLGSPPTKVSEGNW
ncbi:MAG: hypothetical protein HZT41_13885 [Dechloromonas sp.]|nr:MAG: hypothetical protein HZT41_13885 [Dechloromonas sp.]